jgi:hypothetical protein
MCAKICEIGCDGSDFGRGFGADRRSDGDFRSACFDSAMRRLMKVPPPSIEQKTETCYRYVEEAKTKSLGNAPNFASLQEEGVGFDFHNPPENSYVTATFWRGQRPCLQKKRKKESTLLRKRRRMLSVARAPQRIDVLSDGLHDL